MRPISNPRQQGGMTLIEIIVAITITGILGAIAAVFIRAPIQGYFAQARRAELTDQADTVIRRFNRDIQRALPNSVRVSTVAGVTYVEYLEVRTGGRYREQPSGGATTCAVGGMGAGYNDVLEIGYADTCFRTLGDVPDAGLIAAGSDSVVVYNLGPGYPTADAYAGANRALIAAAVDGAGEETITIANTTFPLVSPGKRFHVITGPVTYICAPAPAPAGGTLTRQWGYAIAAAQSTPPVGGTASLLATGVTGCVIRYDNAAAVAARTGLVTLDLTLARASPEGATETVNLFGQAHVSNVP